MTESPSAVTQKPEPTLEALLKSIAAAQMPSRFYQLLHIAIPWGIQLWAWGWYRAAGWMFALGFFAVWALCEKRRASAELTDWRDTLNSGFRAASAALAGLTTAVLLVEGFVQLLKILFNCPGCAG